MYMSIMNIVLISHQLIDRAIGREFYNAVGNSIDKPGSPCEIYSNAFIGKLCEITSGMKPGNVYRLQGEIIPSQRIASFNLDTFEMIQRKGEEDGV